MNIMDEAMQIGCKIIRACAQQHLGYESVTEVRTVNTHTHTHIHTRACAESAWMHGVHAAWSLAQLIQPRAVVCAELIHGCM